MSEIALDTLKSVKNYQTNPYLGQNSKFSKNPNNPGHPLPSDAPLMRIIAQRFLGHIPCIYHALYKSFAAIFRETL